jgi:hypothetical protein
MIGSTRNGVPLTVVETGSATLTWTLPLFMTVSQLRVSEGDVEDAKVGCV